MNVLLKIFPNFSLKLFFFFFEMLVMDRYSKNSNSLFNKTSMDASGWIRKRKDRHTIFVAK